MNLSQIEFVSAVAELQSFTEAAKSCHVTQPTLSNGIAQLENELGGRLFHRTTRSVSLTPLAVHLLPYFREILGARKALFAQASTFLNPATQLLRIGISPLIHTALLGAMLEPFQREHPHVEVVLREMNMADLYQMLSENMLDYIIGTVTPHKERWDSAFLYQEPMLYIPSGKNKINERAGRVAFTEIANDTYVMVPDACGLSRATRDLFRRHRKHLNEYSGEAMSYQVLEDWAALRIGSAILPKSKVSRNREKALRIIGKDHEVVQIGFEAVWIPTENRGKHLKAFDRHLQHVAPQILKGLAMADEYSSEKARRTFSGQRTVRKMLRSK